MRFFTRTRLVTLLLGLLLALALPAAAIADGEDVIRDCAQDGDLDKDYSDEEIEDAYNNMPTDIDEYSDCRDVIRQAQAGGRGSSDGEPDEGGGTGGTGGGSKDGYRGSAAGDDVTGEGGTPGDNEVFRQREEAARNDAVPSTAASERSDDSGLPAAVIVAIVLLLLACIGGGLYALRDRLPDGLTSRLPGFGPGQGR